MKNIPTQMLKGSIGVFAFLILGHVAQAQFSLPLYEPFNYGNLSTNSTEQLGAAGSSGTNWTSGNSTTASSSFIGTNAALSYPGLPVDPNIPSGGLQSYKLGTAGTGKNRLAPFTNPVTNTIYASFLLNIQSNNVAANRLFFALSSAATASGAPAANAGVWLTPSQQLLVGKNSITVPNTNNATYPLVSNNTYLVVMRYQSNAIIDQVDLWLDPTSLGDNTKIPPPDITTTNGNNSRNMLSMAYESPGTGGPTNLFFMDEIRVGTNWAQVTPNSCSPGNTYNVTGGGAACPGTGFLVGLSGSDTGVSYLLYTNGVFDGQIVPGTGSGIDFGAQTATARYTVLASNVTSSCVGWMNTNATISILSGPVITSQPVSLLVATNGLASFSVTAAGAGLKYQWYRNGGPLSDGGNISGSQTPILTISPATPADAATAANGYFVIITNSCSLAATSAPVASLTLDAPANLVWQGGNPNTIWDLAATANWTNNTGTGNFVIFNAGDNVTFDDTSTNRTVSLVGSGIAPTLVTESANQNYTLNGSGSGITGPGSVVKNGLGAVTNLTVNSYTGGTTISAGDLIVRDPNLTTLGSGPVNLAGGTLEIALSGSAILGVSNNIGLTAGSTLIYDGTGSFGSVLFGALTGSPGTPLTITHNVATPTASNDRIRLYGEFTNNLPITINTGSGANMMEVAAYNTNSQVYDGVISGNGGRMMSRGGGVLILNGANTFNDSAVQANGAGPVFGAGPSAGYGYSVLLSTSHIGIGADSSPDFAAYTPGVDSGTGSSPLGTGILGVQVGSEGGTDTLFANGGAHTVANPVSYTSGTNTVTFNFTGSNNLTLSGKFTLSGADNTGNVNRTLQTDSTALTTLSGVIGDAGLTCGINKSGAGILALSAINTYSGPTAISNGTLWVNGQIAAGAVTVTTNGALGGTGTVLGPVAILPSGKLAPGTSAIGTLTINNTLTISGNLAFKVNTSLSPSNDTAVVSGALNNTGTGTLVVSNLGPALVVGDKFTLFNKAVSGGGTIVVSGGGMNWANNLATDGSITATSVASGPATNPTNILFSVSSGNLSLSWPADHLGWVLQVNTNGLTSPNWTDVAGSSTTTNEVIQINPSLRTVFYRLSLQP